jgi:hypothetical protein
MALDDDIAALAPGQQFIYHTGFLACDQRREKVFRTAARAWALYITGDALLTQRRLGAHQYTYLLTLRRTRGPVVSGSAAARFVI